MRRTRPRLLYIFTDPARDATASALVVHRHFALLGERYELFHAHEEAPTAVASNHIQLPARRIYHRLLRTRCARFARALDVRNGFFQSRRAIRAVLADTQPDLVLTIADGSIYIPVREATTRARIPLVTMFHDWTPAWLQTLPSWAGKGAARQVRQTYRESSFAFCICDELHDLLGPKTNSEVLRPLPDPTLCGLESRPESTRAEAPFFALYTGVFGHRYSAETKTLCDHLILTGQASRLRILGPHPGWSPAEVARLQQHSIYRGFVSRDELRRALESAPALLVICPFDAQFELCARYSFPSKIADYCRAGRPFIVWGPKDAAAVRWARRTGAALVVDSPAPDALMSALTDLGSSRELQIRLGRAAVEAGKTHFDPAQLQQIFERGLRSALDGRAEARSARVMQQNASTI